MSMRVFQFKIGQVIWAKVRGYPWWPAQVRHINHKRPFYLIFTLGFFI